MLFIEFAAGIAVKQYSDQTCSKLSSVKYADNTNCYVFSSTGAYLFRSCNCTMIEYDIFGSGSCHDNFIGTSYAKQNTCLDTRQIISCYEIKPSATSGLSYSIYLLFGTIISYLIT